MINVDGGQLHRLTENPDDRFPVWSPDAHSVAFVHPVGHGVRLAVIAPTGMYYSRKNAERMWGERLERAILLERLAMDEAWLALEAKYRVDDLREQWDEIVSREYVRLGGSVQSIVRSPHAW